MAIRWPCVQRACRRHPISALRMLSQVLDLLCSLHSGETCRGVLGAGVKWPGLRSRYLSCGTGVALFHLDPDLATAQTMRDLGINTESLRNWSRVPAYAVPIFLHAKNDTDTGSGPRNTQGCDGQVGGWPSPSSACSRRLGRWPPRRQATRCVHLRHPAALHPRADVQILRGTRSEWWLLARRRAVSGV